MQLTDVRPPPQGQVYSAWLQNTSNQQVLRLGEITLDAVGSGTLSYHADAETVLPAQYNQVLIGLDEPDVSDTAMPDSMRIWRSPMPGAFPSK